MEKRNLIFLITLIVIFAAAWFAGLFFIKKTDVIIFSIAVFATMFIGQRYTLVKIKPVKVRLLWSFLSADLFLYLCGINLLMACLATFFVIIIYRYAPKIGNFFGLNDCDPVREWIGTITDEGEIIGEDRYYDKNRVMSFPISLILVYLLYFIIDYGSVK